MGEHQNVVDIDLDLLDKFDFKDNIVRDILFFAAWFTVFPLISQVLIATKVVLKVSLAQNLISSKFIKGSQQVPHPQNCTEQYDKFLLLLFTRDTLLRQRELSRQLLDHIPIARMILPVAIFVTEVVILIAPHQHDAARFLISEKRDMTSEDGNKEDEV